VGEHVWANVWQENRLVQIDRATGRVVREVGGLVLSSASGMPSKGDAVLNGIAYVDGTGVFFVTGKLWPKMFVVRMPEAE
jgi:glutamine cyclotransferase